MCLNGEDLDVKSTCKIVENKDKLYFIDRSMVPLYDERFASLGCNFKCDAAENVKQQVKLGISTMA